MTTASHPITPKVGALRAWELGFNVTAIERGSKKPAHMWKQWETQRQPRPVVESLGTKWRTSEKIWNGNQDLPIDRFGIISGIADVRSIDIDGIPIGKDEQGNFIKQAVPPEIRTRLLEALGLPDSYDWSGPSSSGKGAHIFVCCAGELPLEIATAERAKGETGVIVFEPLPAYATDFDHIELRWERCQTVLPNPYGYTNATLDVPPAEVSVDRLIAALSTIAAPKAKAIKATKVPKTAPETSDDTEPNVIDLFNERFTCAQILERNGYRPTDEGWEHPNTSQPGTTGVKRPPGDTNEVHSFSATDPLNNGHNHKPFSLLCILEYNNDIRAAVKAAAEALGLPARIRDFADDGRPRIVVRDLDIPTIVHAAWAALLNQEALPLYRRDGMLYELSRDDEQSPILIEMSKPRLRGYLARVAQFVEQREKHGQVMEWVVEPPSSILDDMLIRIHADIPLITRITRCPFVTEDGAIVATPGYHAASRIFYEPLPGVTIPAIPAQPTEADMIAARALILDELLGDFKFVDNADKAHAVALLLLPYLRDAIRGPTPLHLIEAPGPGSGKTLLADVALLPAFGVAPTPITEAGNDDEWRKRITSVLSSTPAAVYIDNINHTLAGGAISAALTAPIWSDRLLGTNKTMSAPVRCVWVATANNPTLSDEVARRCIRIRIDPREDKPWQRTGFQHPNLRQWALEQQGAIVGAALTLIRYGFTVDSPVQSSLGSFEAWSKLIGRILHAAGILGFLGNLDELYDRADTEGAAWRALIAAWWEQHGTAAVTGADVFEVYNAGDYDLNIRSRDEKGQRSAFGKRLKKQLDRIIDGYQVASLGMSRNVQQWKLVPMNHTPTPTLCEGCEDCEDFDPHSMHIREDEPNEHLPCDANATHIIPVHVETVGVEILTTLTTLTHMSAPVTRLLNISKPVQNAQNGVAPVDTPLPAGPLTTIGGFTHAQKEYRAGGRPAVEAWLKRVHPHLNVDDVIAQLLLAEQGELINA